MFETFETSQIEGAGARISVRIGGPPDGTPVLLLHGYPQTSAMWHRLAPLLATDHRVVCADLRGYGQSDKPEGVLAYAKRAMAADMVNVMTALGHDRFAVLAHDRGARVAHRLGLDHPARVTAMTLLDIAPTADMYAATDRAFATAYWHWFFLIQPAPIPERIIQADPDAFWLGKCLKQAGYNPFAPDALAEYLAAFREPAAISASCNDYRAAAGIDLEHDADNARLTMPLQVLWARHGVIETCFDALSLWQQRAVAVEGRVMDATHYMAEEIPDEIETEVRAFWAKLER